MPSVLPISIVHYFQTWFHNLFSIKFYYVALLFLHNQNHQFQNCRATAMRDGTDRMGTANVTDTCFRSCFFFHILGVNIIALEIILLQIVPRLFRNLLVLR